MGFKYLYIDDASKELMKGTISGLKEENYLDIVCENPVGDWEEQRDHILQGQKSFDGLLLDLRLEDFKNEKNKISYFKGTSLAQELRTLSKENAFEEIPIVLLSATANMASSFDSTGFDLFDIIIQKEKLNAEEYPIKRKQLFSLAKGYKELKSLSNISSAETLTKVLGQNAEQVDNRFQQKAYILLGKTSHEFVRFYLREFLERDGVLICKKTLAARLGIQYSNSTDWEKLIQLLEPYSYKGLFNEGWVLWWAKGIENWWHETLGIEPDLKFLNSEQRVSLIRQKTDCTELLPIQKGKYSNSTTFWNICSKTGLPIDPIESVLASSQDNLYPWQDRLYISLEQALNGPKNDLSPLEWERVEKLQNFYTRERVRREQE